MTEPTPPADLEHEDHEPDHDPRPLTDEEMSSG